MKDNIFTISNAELEDCESLGDEVVCKNCGNVHKVKYGDRVLEDGTKVPSKVLAYIKCDNNDQVYLVGISGKLLK